MAKSNRGKRARGRDVHFARLMMEAIRQAGGRAPLYYDPQHCCIQAEGRSALYLGKAYKEYKSAPPAQRSRVLLRYVSCWFAQLQKIPACFADVHSHLRPVVRGRVHFELEPLLARKEGWAESAVYPFRVLAEHLGVGLGYDLPDVVRFIGQDILTGWGVTFHEALEAACQSLRGISREPLREVIPGVWSSPWDDGYAAARLLLPDLLQLYPVRGDLVALAPSQESLVLTGSEDEAGLAYLAALARQGAGHPHPLPPTPLQLGGESWVPFSPAGGTPLAREARRRWMECARQDYAAQQMLLPLDERVGAEAFVASYSVKPDRATGELRSYSTWTAGIISLLPRTDEVGFIKVLEGGRVEVCGLASWERVEQVAGSLMERLDVYPERYRVCGFPGEEQLRALCG